MADLSRNVQLVLGCQYVVYLYIIIEDQRLSFLVEFKRQTDTST